MKNNKHYIFLVIFLFIAIIGIDAWKTNKISLNFFSSRNPEITPLDEEQKEIDVMLLTKICNIQDYGAISDGKTKNTQAFANAIEDCAKDGGGQVLVPAGKWLTGPINLKNNIRLHLDKEAEILFSKDFNDYLPIVFTRFEGTELYNYSPFIYTKNCQNIAITGEGKINGQGQDWNHWNDRQKKAVNKLYKMAYDHVPVKERIFGTEEDALRPSFIQFINCRNVLLKDVTIEEGPMWTVHFVYSEKVHVDNIKVYTSGHNTDGIAIDSSKKVTIENSYFETGDDCITIKSGLDTDGWRVNRPSEDIVIRNCRALNGHGGVALGSEMSAGIRNVTIENCEFRKVDFGIRLKTIRGRGGFMENITVKNVAIHDALYGIHIDMTYPAATVIPKTDKTPAIRQLNLQNITGEGIKKLAVLLEGLPDQPVEDVTLENINIQGKREGVLFKNVSGATVRNMTVNTGGTPLYKLANSKDITFQELNCLENKDNCLEMLGESTENISIGNYNTIKEKIQLAEDLDKDKIKLE